MKNMIVSRGDYSQLNGKNKLHHQPEFYNSGPVEKKQKCTQGPACHKDNDVRKMAQSLHHSWVACQNPVSGSFISATPLQLKNTSSLGSPTWLFGSKPVLWQPEDKLLGTLG
jgi:hypothetical protein